MVKFFEENKIDSTFAKCILCPSKSAEIKRSSSSSSSSYAVLAKPVSVFFKHTLTAVVLDCCSSSNQELL